MKVRLLGTITILALVFGAALAQSGGQEYIVTLKAGNSIAALNKDHGTQTLGHVRHTRIYLIKASSGDSNSVLAHLQNDQRVNTAEPNRRIKLRSNQQASFDPGLANGMASLLDGHTLTTFFGTNVLKAYVDQPALSLTHINDVRTNTGAGTRIAYIDTGVDPYHPALRPWLDPGVDLLNNNSVSELDGLSNAMASMLDNGMASLLDNSMASLLDKRFFFLLDNAMASMLDSGNDGGIFPPEFGHGTLVAGVLHVVAPNARLVPIKAFDPYGNSSLFSIIQGVYIARDLDVDVLNMSFSTSQDSVTLRKAIADAAASGVAMAASVGNDGSPIASVYPASYARVIGVGATDFANHIAGFSNYGSPVSVMATGAFVITTAPGGHYAAAWGTSFSAPIVSGTLSLLAATGGHGHSDSSQVVNTADNIDGVNPGFTGKMGRGLMNARQALRSRN